MQFVFHLPNDDDNYSLLFDISCNTKSTFESEYYDVVCENTIEEDSAMDDDLLGVVIDFEELELLEQHKKDIFQMI